MAVGAPPPFFSRKRRRSAVEDDRAERTRSVIQSLRMPDAHSREEYADEDLEEVTDEPSFVQRAASRGGPDFESEEEMIVEEPRRRRRRRPGVTRNA